MATLYNNRILNVELGASVQPEIGGGGIPGSFYRSTGTVTVVSLELRENIDGVLLYTIYDVNGLNNQFGDPATLVTGETSVRWNGVNKIWEVSIDREIEARGNRINGEMSIGVILHSLGFKQSASAFATVPGRTADQDQEVAAAPVDIPQEGAVYQDNLVVLDTKGNEALQVVAQEERNFESELTKEDGPGCCTPELEWREKKWWEDTTNGRLEIGTVVSYQGCCYRVVNINQTKDPVTGEVPGVVEGTPPASSVLNSDGETMTFYSTAYGTGEVDYTTKIEQRRAVMARAFSAFMEQNPGLGREQAEQRFKNMPNVNVTDGGTNADEIERIKPGGSMRFNDINQGHDFPFKYIESFDDSTGAWGDKLIKGRSVAKGRNSPFEKYQRIQIGCRQYRVHDTGNLADDELDIFCGDDKELYTWLARGPGSKMWQKRGNQPNAGLPNVKKINNGWLLCPCCGPVSTPIELSQNTFNALYIYGTSAAGSTEGKSGFWYPLFRTREEAAAANPIIAGNYKQEAGIMEEGDDQPVGITAPEGWKRTTTPGGKQGIAPINIKQQLATSIKTKETSEVNLSAHTHTFIEFPEQVFYMPSNIAYHGVPTPPPVPGSISSVRGQSYTQLLPISETSRKCFTPTHVVTENGWYNGPLDNWSTRLWPNSVGESVPTDVVTSNTVVQYKEKCYKVTNVPLVETNLNIEPDTVVANADAPDDCTCDEGGCIIYLPDRAGVPIEEWNDKFPPLFGGGWFGKPIFNLPIGWEWSTEDPRTFDDYNPDCWTGGTFGWPVFAPIRAQDRNFEVKWIENPGGGIKAEMVQDPVALEKRDRLEPPPEGAVASERRMWCRKCIPRFEVPDWEPPLTQEERKEFEELLNGMNWPKNLQEAEELGVEEFFVEGEFGPGLTEVIPDWDAIARHPDVPAWAKEANELSRRGRLYEEEVNQKWAEDFPGGERWEDVVAEIDAAVQLFEDQEARVLEAARLRHTEQAEMWKEVPCCTEGAIEGLPLETEETSPDETEEMSPEMTEPSEGTATTTGGAGYVGY